MLIDVTAGFQPNGDCVVGQLCFVFDNGRIQRRLRNAAIIGYEHFHDHRQPFAGFVQRTEIRREFVGKHRKSLNTGIDRRGVVFCSSIKSGIQRYKPIDVCNSNVDPDAATLLLSIFNLIQILGFIVVDGGPEPGSDISYVQ